MVEIAQANHIKVILASVPPAADFARRRGLNPVPQIRALDAWLKAYAQRRKVVFVDYWPVLATPEGAMKPSLSPDGVNPNAAGYDAMSPLAEAAVRKALSRKPPSFDLSTHSNECQLSGGRSRMPTAILYGGTVVIERCSGRSGPGLRVCERAP